MRKDQYLWVAPWVGLAVGIAAGAVLAYRQWFIPDGEYIPLAIGAAIIAGIALFFLAVRIELANPPQHYSLKRSKRKYLCQWASFALILLAAFIMTSAGQHAIASTASLGAVGSMAAKTLGTALSPAPTIPANSKEMKARRKAADR